MSTAATRKLLEALDDLSEENIAALAQLADALRAKVVAGPIRQASSAAPARVTKLGGLWQGYTFSEQEIDDARRDAWAGLGARALW